MSDPMLEAISPAGSITITSMKDIAPLSPSPL